MSQLPENPSSLTEGQERGSFVLIIPCHTTKDSSEILRRVITGLHTALQVAMLFEDDAEGSPVALVEFTSRDEAEIAVSKLNDRYSRFIFAGFPRVLKSLPKYCTDVTLHNLIQQFGFDQIVTTRIHNKLEGIILFRTEAAARDTQCKANSAQLQLQELDYWTYLPTENTFNHIRADGPNTASEGTTKDEGMSAPSMPRVVDDFENSPPPSDLRNVVPNWGDSLRSLVGGVVDAFRGQKEEQSTKANATVADALLTMQETMKQTILEAMLSSSTANSLQRVVEELSLRASRSESELLGQCEELRESIEASREEQLDIRQFSDAAWSAQRLQSETLMFRRTAGPSEPIPRNGEFADKVDQ